MKCLIKTTLCWLFDNFRYNTHLLRNIFFNNLLTYPLPAMTVSQITTSKIGLSIYIWRTRPQDLWKISSALRSRLYMNLVAGSVLDRNTSYSVVILYVHCDLRHLIVSYVVKTCCLTVAVQWTRLFRVSKEINDACFFGTKVWRSKTALIAQQIVPLKFF